MKWRLTKAAGTLLAVSFVLRHLLELPLRWKLSETSELVILGIILTVAVVIDIASHLLERE